VWLLEILGSAHVLVRQIEWGRRWRAKRRLDQRSHGAVAAGFERQGAFASGFESHRGEIVSKAQDPHGTAQGLLGMFTASGLGLHDAEGGRTYDKGAFKNPIQMLVNDGDMLLGAVHATG
jgi:hypothetical protein